MKDIPSKPKIEAVLATLPAGQAQAVLRKALGDMETSATPEAGGDAAGALAAG